MRCFSVKDSTVQKAKFNVIMIKSGDIAPLFSLKDQHGMRQSLKDLISKKVVVLYFYPKDESAGCTAQACAFRDSYEDFLEAGAEVVGVSIDDTESHWKFAEHRQLPYILLSDPDLAVHKMYGADSSFFGLLRARISFVIDQSGVVRHVFDSHLQPTRHVRETLSVIQDIQASKV